MSEELNFKCNFNQRFKRPLNSIFSGKNVHKLSYFNLFSFRILFSLLFFPKLYLIPFSYYFSLPILTVLYGMNLFPLTQICNLKGIVFSS